MTHLVPWHGGLQEPVNRLVPEAEASEFAAAAADLPKIKVTESDRSTVERIADGVLSPLMGFMNEDVFITLFWILFSYSDLVWE